MQEQTWGTSGVHRGYGYKKIFILRVGVEMKQQDGCNMRVLYTPKKQKTSSWRHTAIWMLPASGVAIQA